MKIKRIKKRGCEKGFTMGEMVIVIAIIAILAALITPLAVNVITQNRINTCRDELKIIKQAIVGDPSLVEGGTRSSFGFLGDVGMLPRDNLGGLGLGQNNTLGDLISQNTLPNWQTTSNVMWGWRGPYINEANDPWGRPYIYTTNTGNPLISAIIWSVGPDGANGTADDISITIHVDEAYSRVGGNTLDNAGAGTACTITIYAPNGSIVQVINGGTTTTANPIYNPPDLIPIGIRWIRFTVGANIYNRFLYINNGPFTTVNFREP